MRSRVWHSFRVEIILYTFLSMLFSILTVIVLFSGIYLIQAGMKEATSKKPVQENISKPDMNWEQKANARAQFEAAAGEDQKFPPQKRESGLYYEEHKPFIKGWAVGAVFLTLLFFVIYFLLLTQKFAHYLNEIADGIMEISAGNFDVELSIRHEDELSMIAEGLNKMTGDIKLMMENERNMERTKNDLITNVAHDLRTPLTSIIGYLGLVTGKQELDQETKDRYVSIAYDKSKRLERLIEDLFSFTKVSFGQITMHRTTIDMVKLTEQLLDEFYPSIQDAGLEIEFSSNEKSIPFELDGDQMARAIANLLSNAIKYGRDGKRLRVELQNSPKAVKFFVTNYGKIIPSSDLEHIFDKFYRVESSRSRDTGGTGLGLAITRNVVRMHDGTVHVKSDPAGTVFTVTLYYNPEDNPEGQGEEDHEDEQR